MSKHTTIYLTDEARNIVDEYNINLSKFISEQLEEHYRDIESIKEELKNLEVKKKELLEQKEILELGKEKFQINDDMQKELKDMANKLLEGFDVNAMFKRFKTDFNLFDLKRSEFLKLLKENETKNQV